MWNVIIPNCNRHDRFVSLCNELYLPGFPFSGTACVVTYYYVDPHYVIKILNWIVSRYPSFVSLLWLLHKLNSDTAGVMPWRGSKSWLAYIGQTRSRCWRTTEVEPWFNRGMHTAGHCFPPGRDSLPYSIPAIWRAEVASWWQRWAVVRGPEIISYFVVFHMLPINPLFPCIAKLWHSMRVSIGHWYGLLPMGTQPYQLPLLTWFSSQFQM